MCIFLTFITPDAFDNDPPPPLQPIYGLKLGRQHMMHMMNITMGEVGTLQPINFKHFLSL